MTELEKLSIDEFLIVELPNGEKYGVAELFEDGVSNGVIFSSVGWFDDYGNSFNPFHKLDGAIIKVDDGHFAVGGVAVKLADGNPNIINTLYEWDELKSNEPRASRDACFEAVKKSIQFRKGL